MSFRIPIARFRTAGVKSAARISFAMSAIFLSIEASMRVRAFEPFFRVRALNFIRLMSLSSAPIFLKLARTFSMRRRRAIVQVLLVLRDVDELVDDPRVASRVLEELQDLLEDDRVVGERLVDLRFALLDALGDADLALAVEELDRAHLAQVHAHGVVGLLDRLARLFRRLGLESRSPPRRAVRIGDDLDAHVEEASVNLLEIVGDRRHFVGEDRLDLFVKQVALLLARLEEQLHFRVLFLNSPSLFLSETASIPRSAVRSPVLRVSRPEISSPDRRSSSAIRSRLCRTRLSRSRCACSRALTTWSTRSPVGRAPRPRRRERGHRMSLSSVRLGDLALKINSFGAGSRVPERRDDVAHARIRQPVIIQTP